MTSIQGDPGEIHELARYEVRPDALGAVISAVHEFVAPVEFVTDRQVDANAAFRRISQRRWSPSAQRPR